MRQTGKIPYDEAPDFEFNGLPFWSMPTQGSYSHEFVTYKPLSCGCEAVVAVGIDGPMTETLKEKMHTALTKDVSSHDCDKESNSAQ